MPKAGIIFSVEESPEGGYEARAWGIEEGNRLEFRANFVKDGKWWVAWTDDVSGALTQGATLEEARENLIDAVRMIQEPVDISRLPKGKVVVEEIEV